MIFEEQKFRLKDENKKNDLFAEVNWNKTDAVYPCKVVRFTLGNEKAHVSSAFLFAFLWAIGNPAQQRKSVPMQQTTVRHYNTIVSVKAKKDIHKGENITFPISISLPTKQEEVIGDVARYYKIPKKAIEKKQSGILVPKKVEDNKK